MNVLSILVSTCISELQAFLNILFHLLVQAVVLAIVYENCWVLRLEIGDFVDIAGFGIKLAVELVVIHQLIVKFSLDLNKRSSKTLQPNIELNKPLLNQYLFLRTLCDNIIQEVKLVI